LTPPEYDQHFPREQQDGPNPKLEEQREAWIRNHILPDGTTATEKQLEEMLPLGSGSASGRAFHPRVGGHLEIKKALIL
jgi:hypothetical protein